MTLRFEEVLVRTVAALIPSQRMLVLLAIEISLEAATLQERYRTRERARNTVPQEKIHGHKEGNLSQ